MNAGSQQGPKELEAFRREVRAFLADKLPPEVGRRVRGGYYLEKEELVSWQRALNERGWGAPNLPADKGGPGWTVAQKYIFEEETALAGAPIVLRNGVYIVAPLLLAHGTPAQQERFIPRILNAEEIWTLGFSESNAGSDLAGLQCSARR